MSNIKSIILDLENLTDDEQIKLWLNLWHFADKELKRSLTCSKMIKLSQQPMSRRTEE